jgi:FAST kinase domain-containing protein 2
MTKQQIVNNPDFIKLCKRLKSQARSITLNDAIEALKIVSYVGVPANSTIVQVLLQLIRHGVNELSLQQIIFLEFIMRNFDKNPLVDALRIAFPLVFEAQLSLKVAQDDATNLAEFLQYACKKPLSDCSVNIIIESLGKLSQDIDMKTAKSVVWSLCEMKRPLPSHQALLIRCWDILTHNIQQCSYTEIEDLLSWMVKKTAWKQTQFYHEGFADSCARYVVAKDCGFEKGTWVLKKLTRIVRTLYEVHIESILTYI